MAPSKRVAYCAEYADFNPTFFFTVKHLIPVGDWGGARQIDLNTGIQYSRVRLIAEPDEEGLNEPVNARGEFVCRLRRSRTVHPTLQCCSDCLDAVLERIRIIQGHPAVHVKNSIRPDFACG